MNQVLYRYLRPLQVNSQRGILETLPYGGVCFGIKFLEDETIFSFARCSFDDLFSKSVAKKIVDHRASYGAFVVLKEKVQSFQDLLDKLDVCEPNQYMINGIYFAVEMRSLIADVTSIRAHNKRAEEALVNLRDKVAAETAMYAQNANFLGAQ